jgi:hypothetical protein
LLAIDKRYLVLTYLAIARLGWWFYARGCKDSTGRQQDGRVLTIEDLSAYLKIAKATLCKLMQKPKQPLPQSEHFSGNSRNMAWGCFTLPQITSQPEDEKDHLERRVNAHLYQKRHLYQKSRSARKG